MILLLCVCVVSAAAGCAGTSAPQDLTRAGGSSCPPEGAATLRIDMDALQEAEASCPTTKGIVPRIMAIAEPHFGTRHVYGGTKPGGFDCSGFTAFIYRHFGIKLPRGSYNQLPLGTRVAKEDLQPGDLVFFSVTRRAVVTHVGIYLGKDKMLHASQKQGVTVSNIFKDRYWRKHYYGATRLPQVEKLRVAAVE